MRNRILATVAVSGLVAFAVGFTTSRTAYAAPIDDSRAAPASVLSPLAACWHNHQTFECTQSACIDGPAVADYYACNPSIVTMAVTLCDGWFCTPPEQLVFDIINTALPAVIGHITLTPFGDIHATCVYRQLEL